jgi:hypothetical protein
MFCGKQTYEEGNLERYKMPPYQNSIFFDQYLPRCMHTRVNYFFYPNALAMAISSLKKNNGQLMKNGISVKLI